MDNPSEEMLALVEAINAVLDRNEASHAELQRFASDAAHQLRTPLAVLTARVSGSDGILDRNDIRHDIEWMSRLISQLLSKARAARSEFEVDSRIDLSALALDVVASLAPLAIHRGRQLELSGADYPVPAYGNSELAFEAVSNLVENAIAHSPLNSVVVVHVTQNREIEVIDQGRGVPPDDVERIFSRFSQGRRPTDGGAGLGLSIVSDIMKKHNGAVSYVEREGVGAVFRLSFQ
ncbi:MAG: HAMP domain-containing sensor histidine kinase [Pseudomonadota bacterium]